MGVVEIGRDESNQPIIVEYDDALSFKDYSQMDVRHLASVLTPGKIIYRTQFYWEFPDATPFPDDMNGVTFVYCTLENLIIPSGNTVIYYEDGLVKTRTT